MQVTHTQHILATDQFHECNEWMHKVRKTSIQMNLAVLTVIELYK